MKNLAALSTFSFRRNYCLDKLACIPFPARAQLNPVGAKPLYRQHDC